ncbi:hypothetical protein EU523_00415 [Candidatus Heimdallarchaeota archaeon]|nr:MAG: hypothetical protein EU523_00415 [Candidatus Heimdallarchaeota archaeon]
MIFHEQLLDFIQQKDFQTVAIIGHTSADPDAIGAAVGVKFILKKLKPDTEIDLLMDGISTPTMNLVEYLETSFKETTNKSYDVIFLVDVNVPNQLGCFEELVVSHPKDRLIIIDHHTPTSFVKEHSILSQIKDSSSSASELVTRLIYQYDLKPNEKLLTALLTGILYDSRRFYRMDLPLVNVLQKMFDSGVDHNHAVAMLQRPLGFSEKIARVKCASRLRIHRFGDWIVVESKIGAHEGTAGRGLLSLGADAAIVYSTRKNETRLNARAREEFYQKTNLHFGRDIMKVLAKKYNGDGGGHSTAAALNIPKKVPQKELIAEAFKLIESKLSKNGN